MSVVAKIFQVEKGGGANHPLILRRAINEGNFPPILNSRRNNASFVEEEEEKKMSKALLGLPVQVCLFLLPEWLICFLESFAFYVFISVTGALCLFIFLFLLKLGRI